MYICQCYSLNSSHPPLPPPRVHKTVLYICVSFPALQIDSSVPFFSAIKRNEFGSFVVMWVNLESVIQSEVSQKEKNKSRILTHIYMESRKMVHITLQPL